MTKEDHMAKMEMAMQELSELFPGRSLTLFVADTLSTGGGVFSYISNSERQDVVNICREFLSKTLQEYGYQEVSQGALEAAKDAAYMLTYEGRTVQDIPDVVEAAIKAYVTYLETEDKGTLQ